MNHGHSKPGHENKIGTGGFHLSSLQSNDSSVAIAGSNYAHGDLAGMMPRRDSLGLMQGVFGRSPSLGLGSELFADLGATGLGGVAARRGSMESVVDAAIQNLAHRRLSLVGGSATPSLSAMTQGSHATGMTPGLGGMNMGMPSSMLQGMQQSQGMGNQMGGLTPGRTGMSSMNQFLMKGLGLTQAMMGTKSNATFNNTDGPGDTEGFMGPSYNSDRDGSNRRGNVNKLRQKHLQDQRMELQRRQKELEYQRQQLLSAMEERKQVMQRMQQSLQQSGMIDPQPPQQQPQQQPHVPFERRHSLFGGKVGALEGPDLEATGMVDGHRFSSRFETEYGGGRRDDRRGSLDLLGVVAGATQEAVSNPDVTSRNKSATGDLSPLGSGGKLSPGPLLDAKDTSKFTSIGKSIALGLPEDKDWLTPLHCFVRLHCVEVFTATKNDVAVPTKGKRKPIQVGQVGIRCPHCHKSDMAPLSRERGSVYYPTSVSSIYNATMNLLQRHLHSCKAVDPEIMRRYETLKLDDARSGTSKSYWAKSALSLGLVDTREGIRFSSAKPPPLPRLTMEQKASDNYHTVRGNNDAFFNSASNTIMGLSNINESSYASKYPVNFEPVCDGGPSKGSEKAEIQHPLGLRDITSSKEKAAPDVNTIKSSGSSAPLVTGKDEKVATQFSFFLLSQMQTCVFTEADRLGKRKGLPPGFPGLACRHCFGGYGSGRFFPSSIKTLSDTSKTLNVLYNHMMRCRKCPADVRGTLQKFRTTHDEERAKMKFGSQKAFFARIWDRLHDNNPTVDVRKRKFNHPKKEKPKSISKDIVLNARSTAQQALNMQIGGGHLGQVPYLDAANSLSGGLGGLSTAELLNGLAAGNMLPGNNMLNPSVSQQYLATDPESNKRLKLQHFINPNPNMR